jgi:hypothetical protein
LRSLPKSFHDSRLSPVPYLLTLVYHGTPARACIPLWGGLAGQSLSFLRAENLRNSI